jgi:hypothetical protein
VLCLDTPMAVLTLTAEPLPQLPLGVQELSRQGRTNTDTEPFIEHFEVDEVAHGLEGDSFFIASKAANFDTLVPSLIGSAPLIDQSWPSAWPGWSSVAAPRESGAWVGTGHSPAPDGTHSSQRPSATP